jgi:hypothetical protein
MGWMAPLRHQRAKLVFLANHQEREPSMSEITTIGLDLAKHVRFTALMPRVPPFWVNDCGGDKCWRSSAECRAVWSGWKRVPRRTTGRASSLRLGMRYG